QHATKSLPPNPGPTSRVPQSRGWIVLGVAGGGALGYEEFYTIKHPFREEPFEYLDKLASGGSRDGDSVLIEGDTGSGKTTFCEEVAYKSLQSARPVLFLTYDKPDSVKQAIKSKHFDPSN